MQSELLILNSNKAYIPAVVEGITWATERQGVPGQINFNVIADKTLKITEGDAVRFKYNGKNIFYGFIFTLKPDKDIIKVTAYDQLRYLKNKDTYVYTNKTAGEFIQMIAGDFGLQTGAIENTGYTIPSRVEDNSTLFDMIQNALDETLTNSGQMFVLYDDFGKLTLRNIANMKLDLLIDEETAESFDYTSSIDADTYNKVKLIYDNEESGKRDVYISQDGRNINQWGMLQYYDTLKEGENGKAKADALLSLYNRKTKNLVIKNAFGDVRVRAGCMIVVKLNLGDVKLQNFMLVEKCKHNFYNGKHTMDLTLRGGEFIA